MSTTLNPPTTAKDWDDVRTSFSSSIMVDTSISSLAQNLDGLEWPFKGNDEKASTYLDYTFGELRAEFEGRGNPGAADLLIQILRETLSFDEPFGEMVKQTEVAKPRDNPMLKTLSRLQIPENFPLELMGFDSSTRDLGRLEQVETIGQFALFAQNVSQNVIVGGTFRELLNALAQVDEKALSRFVPLRNDDTGLHFFESVVQATRSTDPTAHLAAAMTWFSAEVAQWRRDAAADSTFVSRQLGTLNDAALQKLVANLLAPHFNTPAAKVGAWSALLRWIKR